MVVLAPSRLVFSTLILTLSLPGCGNEGGSGSPAGGAGTSASGAANSGGNPTTNGGNVSGGATGDGGSLPSGGQSSAGQSGGGQAAGGASGAGSGGSGMVKCDTPPSAAPASTWVNATGNLANMASECGNLGLVSAQPCSNRVIAGIAKKGLWQTVDGGKTWTALGSGAGSAVITNRISAIVYDPMDPKIFWESGIYNGGGIYKTVDSGVTFEQLGDITHCDSVSVDLSDPERKTLIAGTHENNTPLHYSKDGGKTWGNIANGLPAGYCTATLALSATNFLVACADNIMRTTNAGAKWDAAAGSKGGVFQPLLASDGGIYWPGSAGGVQKSEDSGVTFASSATAQQSPGIVAPAQFAELPDGRIIINGTDHLLASSDKGKNWAPIGAPLPFAGGGYDGIRGLAYSAQTKTFFIWHWDCTDAVPDDGIMSMGFDWETQ